MGADAGIPRTENDADRIVEVLDDDLIGRVEVRAHDSTVRVHVNLHHRPVEGVRSRHLVDALFALPELADASFVQVSIPLGENEILWEVGRHVDATATRAAGSTCLIDGTLRDTVR